MSDEERSLIETACVALEKLRAVTGGVCCEALLKMDIGWMKTQEGERCMPHIKGTDREMYRVNYCPSCGKYVRDVMLE